MIGNAAGRSAEQDLKGSWQQHRDHHLQEPSVDDRRTVREERIALAEQIKEDRLAKPRKLLANADKTQSGAERVHQGQFGRRQAGQLRSVKVQFFAYDAKSLDRGMKDFGITGVIEPWEDKLAAFQPVDQLLSKRRSRQKRP